MAMTLSEIAQLTDGNDHTQAYIQGCLYLGLSEEGFLIGSLRQIESTQNELGYLPGDLNTFRYKIYQDMMNMAKLTMSLDEYKAFYECF